MKFTSSKFITIRLFMSNFSRLPFDKSSEASFCSRGIQERSKSRL